MQITIEKKTCTQIRLDDEDIERSGIENIRVECIDVSGAAQVLRYVVMFDCIRSLGSEPMYELSATAALALSNALKAGH